MPTQNNSTFGGFGTLLGLPEGVASETDLRRHKRKEATEKFSEQMRESAAGLDANQGLVFQQFAHLGRALGEKMTGEQAGQLTTEDQRGIAIIESAQRRITDLRQDPEFQALDPVEQRFRTEHEMAMAAADGGDYDTYLEVSRKLHQDRLAHRKSAAQAEILETEADVKAAEAPGAILSGKAHEEAMRRGLPVSMVPVGGSPEDVTMVRKMPNGTLVDEQGREVDGTAYLPLEDSLAIADAQAKAATSKGKSVFNTASLVRQIGVSNVAKESKLLDDVETMTKTVERLGQVFTETDPRNIVGAQGSILSFAQNTFNAIKGTARNSGLVFNSVDPETGQGVGQGKTLREVADSFVPDGMLEAAGFTDEEIGRGMFGEISERAARYKGAIMQMIYANARLQEPGARQLSDADIRNSAEALGVADGDPLTVMRRLGEITTDRLQGTKQTFQRRAAQASAYGLDPTSTLAQMYGTDPMAAIDAAQTRASQAFQRGEAAVPGSNVATPGGVQLDPAQANRLQALGIEITP